MKNKYVNNWNGTVTDTTTGLMWQQGTPADRMTWDEAVAYCKDLKLNGHNDWRLPTIHELISLVDFGKYNPAIDTDFFPNTSFHYWSSTAYMKGTVEAWHVYYCHGYVYHGDKSNAYYVRAVKG